MTKIPFTFNKHFDLAGNQTPKLLSLLHTVYLNPFTIILDPPRYFNEIQEITFFLTKKNLRRERCRWFKLQLEFPFGFQLTIQSSRKGKQLHNMYLELFANVVLDLCLVMQQSNHLDSRFL